MSTSTFDDPRLRPAARWIAEQLPVDYTRADLERLIDQADERFDLALSGGMAAILLAEVRYLMGARWKPVVIRYRYDEHHDEWGWGDDVEVEEDDE